MKNTLNYTGKVGKNDFHALPTEYRGEKTPWAALKMPVVPTVKAVSAVSARSAADSSAAMLRRVRDVSAVLDTLAQRAARSVCRALIAKSGLTTTAARGVTWGGKLGGGANAPLSRDNTLPVVGMRHDLTAHFGAIGGQDASGHKYNAAAAYWEKVDALTYTVTTAQAQEQYTHAAAADCAHAAAAAKRAGNMEQYTELKSSEKAWKTEEKAAHTAAKRAEKALFGLVNDYSIGCGVDLYQIAAAYLWERLAVDGLTVDSLTEGTAANGRKSVKTVFQWACILCRRAIRAEGAAMADTAAGYTYLGDGYTEDTAPESETAERVRPAPKLYDVGSDGDGLTTAESLEKLEKLVKMLTLSATQEQIIEYRLKGFSRNDISAKLGVSRGTLNKQLLRIAEKARNIFPAELLKKYGIE